MSTWTHVAGIIRVDGLDSAPLGTATNPDLNKLLGPMCTYDDWDDSSLIPRGSEGGLQYHIEKGPPRHMAAYVVSIWGDLRDYEDAEAIKQWLLRTFKGLMIRNAAVTIEVETGVNVMMLTEDFQEEDKTND